MKPAPGGRPGAMVNWTLGLGVLVDNLGTSECRLV